MEQNKMIIKTRYLKDDRTPGTGRIVATRRRFFSSRRKTGFAVLCLLLLSWSTVLAQSGGGITRAMTVLADMDIAVNKTTQRETGLIISGTDNEKGVPMCTSVAYLHFNMGVIPKDAIITSVVLKLYLKRQMSGGDEQFVKVFELRNQAGRNWPSFQWDNQPVANADISKLSAISSARVHPDDSGKDINFMLKSTNAGQPLIDAGGNVWLLLASAGRQQYVYHSGSSEKIAMRPRLIVEYHMPYQLQYSNWSQYKNDAQHTGQLDWASNSTVSDYVMHSLTVNEGSNYITSDPIICNGLLVFNVQSSGRDKYWTKAYTENGTRVSEIVERGNSQQLIADRFNNVYFLKNASADSIRRLHFVDYKLVDGGTKALAEGAQCNATPVVGFDGSLYLSTDKGLFAYTAFPDFKVKWKYDLKDNSRFGTVALSEDERSVYVYGANGMLTAIDNTKGSRVWEKKMQRRDGAVPVPSVRNKRVCVTNGYRDGSVFYMLDAATGGVVVVDSGEEKSRSQPVVGTRYAYLISDRSLKSYKLEDGSPGPTPSMRESLIPANTMVMDKNDNLYVVSTEKGNQSLTAIQADGSIVKTDGSKFGNLTGNSLLLMPDGKVIVRNDNGIYSFSPSRFAENGNISIPISADKALCSECLYRSNGRVTVSGADTIRPARNIIIQSGLGGVGFGKNFHVKTGSQLSVKTGYFSVILR